MEYYCMLRYLAFSKLQNKIYTSSSGKPSALFGPFQRGLLFSEHLRKEPNNALDLPEIVS